MRSKNWSFNLSLPVLRKDFTRFWPVWGSYLAIWCLILPIPILNETTAGFALENGLAQDIQRIIINAGEHTSLVMSLIYGGLAAFAVWSYLYQSRSASLFHALPVDRGTLFWSHWTAGLGFLVLPNCLIFLLSYLCQLMAGCANPTHLLLWLAITSLENLLFYAIGTVAAHVTGSLPAMPVLYGLVNFAVSACELLMNDFACALYYGVNSLELRLSGLSPFLYLLGECENIYVAQEVVGGDWSTSVTRIQQFDPAFFLPLGLYALAALVMSAIALMIYRRRATESAGDVIAIPWLRPAAKYAFSFGCALALGWLFDQVLFPMDSNGLTIFLSTALGGAIGYIAASMLLKKSFRVFRARQLAGLLAVFALLGAWTLSLHFDLFRVESRVPDSTEVQSVYLTCDSSLTLTEPDDLFLVEELHRAVLRQGEAEIPDANTLYLRLEYTLEDGSRLRRNYHIPYTLQLAQDPTTPAGQAARLMRQPQHMVEAHLPPENAIYDSIHLSLYSIAHLANPGHQYDYNSCSIAPIDGRKLAAALKEDILAGRACVWNPTWNGREELFSISFDYHLPGSSQGGWDHVSIYADEQPIRTLETLTELGYLTEVPHE